MQGSLGKINLHPSKDLLKNNRIHYIITVSKLKLSYCGMRYTYNADIYGIENSFIRAAVYANNCFTILNIVQYENSWSDEFSKQTLLHH